MADTDYASLIRTEPNAAIMREEIANGIEQAQNDADNAVNTAENANNTVNIVNERVDEIIAHGTDGSLEELVDFRHSNVDNTTYTTIGARGDAIDNKIGNLTSLNTTAKDSLVNAINENSSQLAEKVNQADLKTTNANVAINTTNINTQKSRIDNIVTSASNYYNKCLSTDSGALQVVSSGATTGQINLADVTPKLDTYTPIAGDYVRLISNGLTAELLDARVGADGVTYANVGSSIRTQFINVTNELTDAEKYIDYINPNIYGSYDEIVASGATALGSGDIYNIVARNKPIDKTSIVDTFKIRIWAQNNIDSGTVKLCKFDFAGNAITNIVEDTVSYALAQGDNIIKTTSQFEVEKGKYIGFIVTPTTTYCRILSLYPSTAYPYGFIGRKVADGTISNIANYLPAIDVTMCNAKVWGEERTVVSSWLNGKTWVAYGDSITAGYKLVGYNTNEADNDTVNTYVKIVANKYNMTFRNRGTSGRGYSVGAPYQLYNIITTEITNADIVTVAMGTNDYGVLTAGSSVTFGTVSDTADTVDGSGNPTFCACVKKTFDKLNECYPNSIIVIMTPIPRPTLDTPNVEGKTLVDYADAIKTISKYYGFYIMDCLSIARSNVKSSAWTSIYMIDGVHMSQTYHDKYYSAMVERELLRAGLNE